MNHKNKLEEMPVRPLLYTMAVPLMLSLLVQSLYNIVDSMFVARLSEAALTAASLVYPVQFLMIAVGVGTAVGLNALLSRKIGERKTEEACQAATTGLILMLVTSMIFSAAGIFCSDQIADGLTPDPELQKLCRQYLSVNLVYCLGIFLQTYGQRLLQAVGDGNPGRRHCDGYRTAGGSRRGTFIQSLPEPAYPCAVSKLPFFLAGCGCNLPRGAADHCHAGDWKRNDVLGQ